MSNSAVQLQMFDALGAPHPHFAHEALLVAAEGKLSKRLGIIPESTHLREEGDRADGLAVAARSHRHICSRSRPWPASTELAEDVRLLDISAGRRRISIRTRSSCSTPSCFTTLITRTSPIGCRRAIGEAEWLVLRGNLAHLDEAEEWVPVLHCLIAPPEVVPDDKPLIEEAARLAETVDWTADPVARADRRAEGQRPAARAGRCSGRYAWRSPAANPARKWGRCSS